MLRSACCVVLAILLCAAARADETAPEEPREPQPPARSVLQDPRISPQFSIHGFTDVSFVVERDHEQPDVPDTTDDAFALGELDLYLVSHLSESLSFLGELVFELEEDDAIVEVERVSVRYAISDQIWLAAGRSHTPLGYWNPRFHHGLLLQTTIERPLPVRF